MSLFERMERKLERTVNGVFARAFRAEVQPLELASALRRAMDDRATVLGRGRTIVPNLFTFELAPDDYERLTEFDQELEDELVAAAEEHAESQRYHPGGPLQVLFDSDDDLETGVFRVELTAAFLTEALYALVTASAWAVQEGRVAERDAGPMTAELLLGGTPIGHAGELHPRVCTTFGLPARSVAAEVDLDVLIEHAVHLRQAPTFSTFPAAKEDVALVVDESVAAADVEAALREGAGALLESIRLFDVYRSEQLGEGRKSLAFALRFRAPDRTLTDEDTTSAREAAVALAAERTGASQRA